MVGSKQPSAVFLSAEEAENHCRAGGSIWSFASTDEGLNPDVVLVGIGAALTFEVIAAAAILREKIPTLRVRVVNVTDLMILGSEFSNPHPHALTDDAFDALFTETKPIHFNYHGYAQELKGLLFGRPNMARVSIASYNEEGSTTTPFNMMLLNGTSRYHVAIQAIQGAAKENEKVRLRQHELVSELEHQIKEVQKFIVEKKTGTFPTLSITKPGWRSASEYGSRKLTDCGRSGLPQRRGQHEDRHEFAFRRMRMRKLKDLTQIRSDARPSSGLANGGLSEASRNTSRFGEWELPVRSFFTSKPRNDRSYFYDLFQRTDGSPLDIVGRQTPGCVCVADKRQKSP